jgi:hypothetical protein
LPLAFTFQIVGSDLHDDRAADDESGADVGGGLLNLFHSITFPAIIVTRSRAFAVPPTSWISGAPPDAPASR